MRGQTLGHMSPARSGGLVDGHGFSMRPHGGRYVDRGPAGQVTDSAAERIAPVSQQVAGELSEGVGELRRLMPGAARHGALRVKYVMAWGLSMGKVAMRPSS